MARKRAEPVSVAEYNRGYMAKWRAEHRDWYRAYNRAWMRRHRIIMRLAESLREFRESAEEV